MIYCLNKICDSTYDDINDQSEMAYDQSCVPYYMHRIKQNPYDYAHSKSNANEDQIMTLSQHIPLRKYPGSGVGGLCISMGGTPVVYHSI